MSFVDICAISFIYICYMTSNTHCTLLTIVASVYIVSLGRVLSTPWKGPLSTLPLSKVAQ